MLNTNFHRHSSGQQGFSLVELLVAMLLGLIILFAVSELFVSNHRVRNELELSSRQIENGRYAVQLLADDLSNAGYFGETGTQDFPADFPPACFTTADHIQNALGVPVFGEHEVAAGSEPACLDDFKGGNSYLSLRRASTCAAGGADCDAFVDGQYHLQVSACQSEDPGVIKKGSTAAGLAWKARNCTDVAPRYRFLGRIYYVNQSDQLVRAELSGVSDYVITPLVDGVEEINFEYGVDTNGDGVPNDFIPASDDPTEPLGPGNANWGDVVAVRIWILTRNTQTTAGYEDTNTYTLGDRVIDGSTLPQGFKRQVYSSTVRLNNIAGRREAS